MRALFGVLLQEVSHAAERLVRGLRDCLLALELLERRRLLRAFIARHLRAYSTNAVENDCTALTLIARLESTRVLVQTPTRGRRLPSGAGRRQRTRSAALLARRRSRARRLCAAARCCRA